MSDTWYLDLLPSPPKTYTADGIIAATWDLELATHLTPVQTYTADGIIAGHAYYDLTAPVALAYTADGVIVSTIATTATKTYTADGVIATLTVTDTKSYTADGIIISAAPSPGPPGPYEGPYETVFVLRDGRLQRTGMRRKTQ